MTLAKLNVAYTMACLFGFATVGHSSSQKCPEAGWIPYKDSKCIKIIQSDSKEGKNFQEASKICEGLLPFEKMTGQDHPSSVLQIESEDEGNFIQGLVPKGSKIWVDTKTMGFVAKNLLKLQPTPLRDHLIRLRNCTKFNPDIISDSGSLKLERGPCTGTEQTIVCQNVQTLPLEGIQKYLFGSFVKDFITLKYQLGKAEEQISRMESLNNDFSRSMNVLKTENQERDTRLRKLERQDAFFVSVIADLKASFETSIKSFRLEDVKINSKLMDLEEQDRRLESLMSDLSRSINMIQIENQLRDMRLKKLYRQDASFKLVIADLKAKDTVFETSLEALEVEDIKIGSKINDLEAQDRLLESLNSELSRSITVIKTDNHVTDTRIQTLKRQDAVFESMIADLKGKDKLFETSLEALEMEDIKTGSKVKDLEAQDRRLESLNGELSRSINLIQTKNQVTDTRLQTLERQDAFFESVIADLKGKDKLFETSMEALEMEDIKTGSKVKDLEAQDQRLESLKNDLSSSIKIIQTENQVRDTRLQTLEKETQALKDKTEKMEAELKKRKLQHGIEVLRLNRKFEDINTRLEVQQEGLGLLQHQVDLVKGTLSQTVKSTEFKSQMEDLENNIESQIQKLNSTQSILAYESTAFRTTMKVKGDIVDGNLVKIESMILTASGVQADVAKLQVVVTTLERQDAAFQSEISNLQRNDKGFATAIDTLKIEDVRTDSKVKDLERRFNSKMG